MTFYLTFFFFSIQCFSSSLICKNPQNEQHFVFAFPFPHDQSYTHTHDIIPGNGKQYKVGDHCLCKWSRCSCRPVLSQRLAVHRWYVPACGTPHSPGLCHVGVRVETRWAGRRWAGQCWGQAGGGAVARSGQQGATPGWEWMTSRWMSSPALCRLPPSPRTFTHTPTHTHTHAHSYKIIKIALQWYIYTVSR